MTSKNIFISTGSFAEFSSEPLTLLKQAGYSYTLNPHGRTLKPDEIVPLMENCAGLVAGTEKLTAEILAQLKHMKVISRCGAGVDNVDLAKAKELNIQVFNTPDAPTLAVAELTIGLALNLLRKISLMDKELHASKWNKQMGNLLLGKKVGIIGYGRIGRTVATMFQSFGCQVAYCDPHVEEHVSGVEKRLLPELLRWADVISLHVSSAQEIIGRKEFELIKDGSWIINTSRGGVIDQQILFDRLNSRRIAGAALDVFAEEPYQGNLCSLDNVILTPHIGSYAKEARIRMEVEAVKNLLKGLQGASA